MATVSLQTVFDDARRAIEAGAADKAIGIAQHILVHFPRTIEGFRLLGEAYLNDGQPEQAAAAFAQVLHADPENIAAYYGQGLALQSVEQRPAAITAFERALEIQPNLGDLRTQLLRLYSATPGSAGQFRLSRAGLGRLYARGGMFSQAIDEFRAVLDVEPDRDDVKVALAEALWRDGQEDEAADFCRDVLEQHPDLIKPTVLLGYMLFASGQPEGEKLWRRAAEQDATMALARTLFDIMPPIRIEEAVLPEFDEAEWRAQEARRAAEQTPVLAAPAEAVEDDLFADSWLGSAGSAPLHAASSAAFESAAFGAAVDEPAARDRSDDDLLASLLGFGDDASAEPADAGTQDTETVQPFSFDDWDAEAAAPPSETEPLPTSLDQIGLADDVDSDVGDVKPFSFEDWSFDETDSTGDQPAASAADDDEQPEAFAPGEPSNVRPFTLDAQTEVPGVQPFSLDADEDDAPAGVQPFSFDDVDEDFGVAPFAFEADDAAPSDRTTADDAGLGNVQPFSLDEWGTDETDTTSAATAPSSASGGDEDDLGGFKPFSLDELALDALEDDSTGALEGPQLDAEPEPRSDESGFSWQEPSWRSQTVEPPRSSFQADDDETIFSKLMRNRAGEPSGTASPTGSAEQATNGDVPHFFSVDDEPLRLDFGDIDRDAPTGEFADQPEETEPTQAAAPETAAPVAEEATDDEASAVSDDTTPFSLDDLAAADKTFSWDADELRADQTASDDELVPFSLSDLGLSDEELADLDKQPELAGDAAAAESAEPSFALSDLGLTDDELAALDSRDTVTSGDAEAPAPFSLSDLGLSEEELAGLDFGTTDQGETASPNAAQPTSPQDDRFGGMESDAGTATNEDTEDLVPFSLDELGLSDDELELLNQHEERAETEGGFAAGVAPEAGAEETSDELASLLAGIELDDRRADDQAADDVSNSDLTTEWLDFQSELDVDRPETRTPSDFLEEAQGGSGDVEGVLETMPGGDRTGETSEPEPFSLADLGLTDEELSRLNEGVAPSTAQAFAEDQSEPVDDFWAAASDGTDEAPTSEPTRVPEAAEPSEARAGEPLPLDLPEGAQPVASTADEPSVQAAAAPPSAGVARNGMGVIQQQLASDPENDALRLALARMSASSSDLSQALEQYKQLIKRGRLLDDVVDDLQESIADAEDPHVLRRLHRLLGDAYMKQSRFEDAMTEYSWTSGA